MRLRAVGMSRAASVYMLTAFVSAALWAGTTQPLAAQSEEENPLAGAEGLGWVKGDPDAPITVVEFTDVSCPYCARFHEGTRQALIDEFVPTGQVRWITLTYVSGLFPNSEIPSLAVECAGRQGRYEDFAGRVYAERDRWVRARSAAIRPIMDELATGLDLDAAAFAACMADPTVEQRV